MSLSEQHVAVTKGVIKADMIATPWIFGLLCYSSDFVTSFDNIGVERKLPVIEASPYWPTGSVVFFDNGHSVTLLGLSVSRGGREALTSGESRFTSVILSSIGSRV